MENMRLVLGRRYPFISTSLFLKMACSPSLLILYLNFLVKKSYITHKYYVKLQRNNSEIIKKYNGANQM